MKNKKIKAGLFLVIAILMIFLLPQSISAYPTIQEALQKEKKPLMNYEKILQLEKQDENTAYAILLIDNNRIAVATIYKNMFGWKTGIVTSQSFAEVPKNSNEIGYTIHDENFYYGVTNDDRIKVMKIDGEKVTMIPLKENYLIWFKSNVNNDPSGFVGYDSNQKIIYQINM